MIPKFRKKKLKLVEPFTDGGNLNNQDLAFFPLRKNVYKALVKIHVCHTLFNKFLEVKKLDWVKTELAEKQNVIAKNIKTRVFTTNLNDYIITAFLRIPTLFWPTKWAKMKRHF